MDLTKVNIDNNQEFEFQTQSAVVMADCRVI